MRTRLHQIVSDMARERPEAPALTFKDQTATYAELWEQTKAFGCGLGALGLERGDRVGLLLDKRVETVVSILGCSASGAAFVPINTLLKGRQVAYIVDDCDVRVLVTTAQRYPLVREELAACTSLEHVIVLDGEAEGATTWQDFLRDGEPDALGAIDVDMAAIFYTSGSTGKPKGVVLSHRNLIVGAPASASIWRTTRATSSWRRCRSASTPDSASSRPRSPSERTSCWSTTCSPAMSSACAPSTG